MYLGRLRKRQPMRTQAAAPESVPKVGIRSEKYAGAADYLKIIYGRYGHTFDYKERTSFLCFPSQSSCVIS